MIKIELPVLYSKNAEEINKNIELGINIEEELEDSSSNTTFYLDSPDCIRINPATIEGKSSIYIGSGDFAGYLIDFDYETLKAYLDTVLK